MSIQEHTCNLLPISGVAIYTEDVDTESASTERIWKIVFTREATELDLEESHILENVGDEIWRMEAEINACPYCGERLKSVIVGEIGEGNPDSRQYFRLLDQEAWELRVR